jgi:polysaccharide export outer membrane protein
VVAVAQEGRPRVANVGSGPSGTTSSGIAGGAWSPALTGERRPQYRLHKSDVIDINFSFSPEFNQTVTVQPDGFLSLRGAPGVYGEGQTLLELQSAIRAAYSPILQEPEVTVVLKDFDKPYFVTSGEVTRPGKYELRGDTTVAEAVAMAGGFTRQAKHSQVVLFRHVSAELVEAHLVDVKRMLHSRNLAEDMHLQPGDFVFVPQSKISKIRQFLPASNLSMYINPTQF